MKRKATKKLDLFEDNKTEAQKALARSKKLEEKLRKEKKLYRIEINKGYIYTTDPTKYPDYEAKLV